MEYPFMAIAPGSILTQSGRLGPIYLLNRTIWHLNCVQQMTYVKIEFLEIELFDDLTVFKKMTDV